MKQLSYIFLAALWVLGSACTDDFEEINTDPNTFTEGDPNVVLPGVMFTIVDQIGGEMNFWMFLQYGRYAGGMTGNPMHLFSTGQFNDNYWENLYVQGVGQCRDIQQKFGDDPAYTNRVEIAKILEAYIFSVILSTWGPAPVEAAATGELFSIPFDSETEGYQYILDNLQNASDVMTNTTAEGITLEDGSALPADVLGADPLFEGDNTRWVRFANSLRLKIALRLSNSSSQALLDLSNSHIQDVVANDAEMLILDNSQNAVLYWGDNNPFNWSIFYEQDEIIDRDNQRPSITDELMLWSAAYGDPRLRAFAAPAVQPFVVTVEVEDENGEPIEVQYGLPYLGEPIGGSQPYSGWDLPAGGNPYNGAALDNYSKLNEYYLSQTSEYMLISSAETYFMLAEVAQRGLGSGGLSPAAVYYNQGLDESFARYASRIPDYEGFDPEAFKSQPGVAFNTASDEALFNWTSTSNTEIAENQGLKQIITQRWITMFFQGHDAWCLQKRTELLSWAPFMNPADRGTPFDYPERMVYSPADQAVANEQYQRAVNELLGGLDLLTTPLEMNRNTVQTDWPAFNPEWSTDIVARFYGNSIADLEAAGLANVTDLPEEPKAAALAAGTGYVIL